MFKFEVKEEIEKTTQFGNIRLLEVFKCGMNGTLYVKTESGLSGREYNAIELKTYVAGARAQAVNFGSDEEVVPYDTELTATKTVR